MASSGSAYNRVHAIDLGAQLAHLVALSVPGATGRIKNGGLTFTYEVKPTALSRSYKLELSYARNAPPEVRVIEPDIVALSGAQGRPPHLYTFEHPVRLCLYLPRAGDWSREEVLAVSVVPWSVEWLFYYEMWQVTGKWHGGGAHPAAGKKKNAKQKKRGAR
jgi:hypothetical protein